MIDKNWSGERLETFIYTENTVEHLHRYAITLEYVKGKIVLDIASGEGYGSNLIATIATKVIGVDISNEAVIAAQKKYIKDNLEFSVGDVSKIPLNNNSVDVVVSFETLEHHDSHQEMMIEIKRVLKSDGILIMSTPNKQLYSGENNYINPFHVKELYFNEFKELIKPYFLNTKFYFQNIFKGSLIVPEKKTDGFKRFEGDYMTIDTQTEFVPMYVVVIASDVGLATESVISGFDGNNIEIKGQQELQKKIRDEAVQWI